MKGNFTALTPLFNIVLAQTEKGLPLMSQFFSGLINNFTGKKIEWKF